MAQLSAVMEQTHEMQLAQLYDVLALQRVIARYDVLSTLHETGPRQFGKKHLNIFVLKIVKSDNI